MNMVPLKLQSTVLIRKQVSRIIALRETLNKQGIHCVAGRMESVQLSSTPLPTSIRISYIYLRNLVGGSNISEMHENHFGMIWVARSKLQDRVDGSEKSYSISGYQS